MIRIIKKIRPSHTLLVIIVFLFLYVLYRAYALSFTYDEALSFKIIQGDANLAKTANNHFLNTFLMSVCLKIFGSSELSLRLPNVLAFLLYAYACFELLKNKSLLVLLTGVSLLLLNPYVLDFFSLARGYGLALGFAMAMLLYFFKSIQAETLNVFYRNASLTLLFSIAACFSNLTYININLIVLFLLFISFLLLRKKSLEKPGPTVALIAVLLLNLLCMSWLIRELLKLREARELYYGGNIGFMTDTVRGLVSRSLYLDSNASVEVFLSVLLVVLFVIIIIAVLLLRKYNKLAVVTAFLSLAIIASSLQYVFLDALLPFGRTALIYVPLMGLCIIFLIDDLYAATAHSALKYLISGFSLCIVFPAMYNFVKNMSTDTCYEWWQDRHTRDIMKRISGFAQYSGPDQAPYVLSCNYIFEPSIYYYKTTGSMDFLILGGSIKKNADEDFLFSVSDNKPNVMNADEYLSIETYDDRVNVFRKKDHIPEKEIGRTTVTIRAANNKFVCCETDHHLVANKNLANDWEFFSLIRYADNTCAFRSYEGFFACPELGAGMDVTATRKKRGPWETFNITDLGNGQFAFKAANGKYLSFDKASGILYASADKVGQNETFTLAKI